MARLISPTMEKILLPIYHRLCQTAPEFADVEFNENYRAGGGHWHSYQMLPYATHWAEYAKAVHIRLQEAGIKEGVRSRKRSQAFISEVEKLANMVTGAEAIRVENRFITLFD